MTNMTARLKTLFGIKSTYYTNEKLLTETHNISKVIV